MRNPPGVAQQHNAFFNECLAARLVGYGANGAPYPPYIDAVPLGMEGLALLLGRRGPRAPCFCWALYLGVCMFRGARTPACGFHLR